MQFRIQWIKTRLSESRAILMIAKHWRAPAIFVILMLCTTAAIAQTTPPSNQSPQETVKVEVNVVNLLFNVKGPHSELIPNLHKEDFQVYEDGIPQTVKYFTANSDLPLTLGIMIDTSGSQMDVLNMEKETGSHFLKQIITPKDLAFV